MFSFYARALDSAGYVDIGLASGSSRYIQVFQFFDQKLFPTENG